MEDQYTGEERRKAPRLEWHLRQDVIASIIVTLVTLALSGFWGFADLKKDVEVIKARQTSQTERDAKQDTDIKDSLLILREQYRDLSIKLDRLIEKERKP